MTPHMLDFVRDIAWGNMRGPVLEIGSLIEANQDHLNLRRAFPQGTPYLGVDVVFGPGIDRTADLLDPAQINAAYDAVAPNTILCLYVLEHIPDIYAAAFALAALWKRNPESWLWVATHQNQPYHATDRYGDYWRVTAQGLRHLMEMVGLDVRVFATPNRTIPDDVLAIQKPASIMWPEEAIVAAVQGARVTWERYC